MEIWCQRINASAGYGRVEAHQEGLIRVAGASSLFYASFTWDTSADGNPKLFCSIGSPNVWEGKIPLIPRVFQYLKPELILAGREGVKVYLDTRLGKKICAEGKLLLSEEEKELRSVSAHFALKKLDIFVEDFAREYAQQWVLIAERVVAAENEAQLEPQLWALQLAHAKTAAKERRR